VESVVVCGFLFFSSASNRSRLRNSLAIYITRFGSQTIIKRVANYHKSSTKVKMMNKYLIIGIPLENGSKTRIIKFHGKSRPGVSLAPKVQTTTMQD